MLRDWYDADNQHQGDHDPDGDPLTITQVAKPRHGTARVVQSGNRTSDSPYVTDPTGRDRVSYDPDPGFMGEDSFTYTIDDGRGGTDTATVTMLVAPPPIRWVRWIARAGSPLDQNPNPGGGQRIFPDRDTPAGADRSWVDVRATLTWPLADVPIYLKVIDVDDPSADTGPVDEEILEWDNRGEGFRRLPDRMLRTDANGQVQFAFQVSRQPGDNYRVVASLEPIGDEQFTAIQDDTTRAGIRDNSRGGARVPTAGDAPTRASGLLTVWRRLHIEVDRMGPIARNDVTGTMTVRPIAAGATTVTIETNRALDPLEAGRFNEGTLTDDAGHQFAVVSHTTGADFTVTVSLAGAAAAPAAGSFRLRDDDALSDGKRLKEPKVNTLYSALSEAYVRPVFDVGVSNPIVPFDPNLEEEEADQIVRDQWESRGLNAEDFWVAYILAAFQGPTAQDGDPDSEWDLAAPLFGENARDGGALIYTEVIAEAHRLAPELYGSDSEADTVVHEIGHAVADWGAEPVTRYFGEEVVPPGPSAPSRYTPDYLDAIRWSFKPKS